MSLDRDLFAEVDLNAESLRSTAWRRTSIINNNIAGGVRDYWLDPLRQGDEDAAQYFKYNRCRGEEADRGRGLPQRPRRVAAFRPAAIAPVKEPDIARSCCGEWASALTPEKADYNTVFLPLILSSKGDFDGHMSFSSGPHGLQPRDVLQRAPSSSRRHDARVVARPP